MNILHDKMTQCRYVAPISTFKLNAQPESIYEVDIQKDGKAALEKANSEMGAFNICCFEIFQSFQMINLRFIYFHCIDW